MTLHGATFICGCGHSGTSLLANMFASHPDVFVPLEETDTFLKEDLVPAKLDRLSRKYARSGKRFLVEKTPRHVLVMDIIRAHIARPRFILMVRDGRDVAASFIKRTGKAADGAQRWLKENQIVRVEMNAADCIVVRYEDLVRETESTLLRLCKFLGISFESSMLEYYRQPRLWFGVKDFRKGDGSHGVEHRQLRNWQINQPIFDDCGKWRRLLPAEDLAMFDAGELHELLLHFGYADT